ncbi:MAG: nuclear transport factor 2 family protein [Pedobacter sp.]|nr:nuclear transport factor 2 family protein [Pedobacter sp.]MDQ8052757.1 nuclear transport factor 2 family protein [Pedobacter sp.]
MQTNQDLLTHFYTSFQKRDFQGMQACYSDDATFSDAVFKNLDAEQVKAMWEMLVTKGKDLRIEFSGIEADEKSGKAHWDAYYTFSATGRKVINRIDATFEFKDGKISRHIDTFDFHSWAKQAFGLMGLIFGGARFFQQKIQLKAMKNLSNFMGKNLIDR